ncbi:MgtC/SapB family protein [Petropleomorpha daqingensis]|uniref:Putative Mg2+ transporter-C (MgtC) family protein n=1 Tax=Petropleomorpha daqingensis TaxID=2026353 RepID=A0A853CLE0_9ACTN|nr:MgtC/SapB family protein [Petropleomorpha daqingensis]NYJ07352.1 putative Mg2+ transporter-C (MgtC) family protein [Petropleomorpha daqingensis]
MDVVAAAFSEPTGQGWVQITELLVAFVLSSLIGLERQLRGKSAGLRTQAIVGTASALFLLVSKYGFTDVLTSDRVVLDPSRVAAQIVSGIGFLGAGLIITRRGTARGLTTAAAVWETAAIGMAAGAGLPLLAVVVTVLHFVVVLGYTWVAGRLPSAGRDSVRLRVAYADQQGVLRAMLAECTRRNWVVHDLAVDDRQDDGVADLLDGDGHRGRGVAVTLGLSGPDVTAAAGVLGSTTGVLQVSRAEEETE